MRQWAFIHIRAPRLFCQSRLTRTAVTTGATQVTYMKSLQPLGSARLVLDCVLQRMQEHVLPLGVALEFLQKHRQVAVQVPCAYVACGARGIAVFVQWAIGNS
jgi:hypothetical protein